MAKLSIQGGMTDITLNVYIRDSTVAYDSGLTGLAWNTGGLTCYYVRERSAAANLVLANVAVAGAHTDGGFVEISAANMPGMYRLDLSDVIVASGVRHVTVMLRGAANMVPEIYEIDLDCELGNTQGQIKLSCNVAGEGALHCVNTSATGIAMYNRGTAVGQVNIGTAAGSQGQWNWGSANGQYNQGDNGQYNTGNNYGQANTGALAGQNNGGTGPNGNGQHNQGIKSGQYNYATGIGGNGQYNRAIGANSHGQFNDAELYGAYNVGTETGIYSIGNNQYGIQAIGGIAPLSPNIIDAQAIALSADAEIADAVLDEVVEGTYTLRHLVRLMASALYGKVSGGGTVTVTFRNTGDTINRIVATVDANGNRSAVVLNAL